MNQEGDVVAAHSLDEAIEFYTTIGLSIENAKELDQETVAKSHRVLVDSGRDWCATPAGSKELYIDALGRDLIEGHKIPYLFATEDY